MAAAAAAAGLPAAAEAAAWAWGPAAVQPKEARLDELVASVCAQYPGAVAVEDGAQTLSYGELLELASRLAAHLRREASLVDGAGAGAAGEGAGAARRVGVRMAPSACAVVAVVAVLRAGFAYVPVDLAVPEARAAEHLAAAGARVVCVDEESEPGCAGASAAAAAAAVVVAAAAAGSAPRIGSSGGGGGGGGGALASHLPQRLVVVSRRRLEALPPPGAPAPAAAAAPTEAVVFFTSGSTGRPRGVRLAHRVLAELACYMARTLGGAPGAVAALWTKLGWVASVPELFGMLCSGGAVRVVAHAQRGDLSAACGGELAGVTHLQCSPSVCTAFLESGLPWPSSLRVLVLTGEPLPARAAHGARGVHPLGAEGLKVWNHYGQTEAADTTTAHAILGTERSGVPLGLPIHGRGIFVSEGDGSLLVAGEAALALGYLDAEQTEAAFTELGGHRAFKTGDCAAWRQGTLVYKGRLDAQVKVAGQRVELSEVEAALLACAEVRTAKVLLVEGALTAYVLADSGAAAVGPIQRHCREVLLPYMVPRILPLDAWPTACVDARGKLDSRVLRAPAWGAWQDVLQTAQPGLDDDFFAVGGTSLGLVRLCAQLHALGYRFNVADFVPPTLRRLLELCRGGDQQSSDTLRQLGVRVTRLEPEMARACEALMAIIQLREPLTAACAKVAPARAERETRWYAQHSGPRLARAGYSVVAVEGKRPVGLALVSRINKIPDRQCTLEVACRGLQAAGDWWQGALYRLQVGAGDSVVQAAMDQTSYLMARYLGSAPLDEDDVFYLCLAGVERPRPGAAQLVAALTHAAVELVREAGGGVVVTIDTSPVTRLVDLSLGFVEVATQDVAEHQAPDIYQCQYRPFAHLAPISLLVMTLRPPDVEITQHPAGSAPIPGLQALFEEELPRAAELTAKAFGTEAGLRLEHVVASYRGSPVGAAALWRLRDGAAEVVLMALRLRFRRGGVGRRLLGACGPGRLYVLSAHGAAPFYRRCGFAPTSHRADAFHPDPDCLAMARPALQTAAPSAAEP